jgi:hypothetical protein
MKPAALLLTLALAACATPDASYTVRQDLAQAMARPQAIAVVADEASYQTQLLLPQLKRQLAAQGYRLADDPGSASWVMDLSVQDQMDASQKVHTTLRLDLYSAEGYRGARQTAWTASAATDPQTLNAYGATILQSLLRPAAGDCQGKLYLPKDQSR